MTRLAVPNLFWARPKSEFGEHLQKDARLMDNACKDNGH